MNSEQRRISQTEAEVPLDPLEIVSADGEIVLRQFTPDDAQVAFDLIDRNREHLSQFGDDTAKKYQNYESMYESIVHPTNPDRLRFGIRDKEDVYMGSINLTPKGKPGRGEIGYYIGAEFGGRGITTIAAITLSNYAFEHLGYEELFGIVVEGNDASVRVLQKAGFMETNRRRNEDGVMEIELTKLNPVTV